MSIIDLKTRRKLKPGQFYAQCPECGHDSFKMLCDENAARENNASLWVVRTICAKCEACADTLDDEGG